MMTLGRPRATIVLYKVAFWLTVLHALALLVVLVLGSPSQDTFDVLYDRTPLLMSYVWLCFGHVWQYLWLCFGLSVLAAYHFACKVLGSSRRARVSGVAYVAVKGLFTGVAVLAILAVAVLMRSTDLADVRVFYKYGETGVFLVETIGVVWPAAAEAILSLPLWLILAMRSWRDERSKETAPAGPGADDLVP